MEVKFMAKSMRLRFEALNLAPIQVMLLRRLGWEVETLTIDWNKDGAYDEVRLPKKDNILADYLIMLFGKAWEVVEIPLTLGLVKPNGRPATLSTKSQLVALRALRDCKTVALAARRVGVSRTSLWAVAKGKRGIVATPQEIVDEKLEYMIPSRKNPHSYSKRVYASG
jgi:hypothetical protein